MLYQISNGAVELGAELILKKVNFEIRDREKIAVVGRNGSGKTTLLKLISGEVDLLNETVMRTSSLQRQAIRKSDT